MSLCLLASCAAPAKPSAPAPAVPAQEAPAAGPRATASQPALPLESRGLDAIEKNIVAHVDAHAADAVAFLERVVNVNSGSMNHEGVREVGKLFAGEFEALGFEVRWIPMSKVNRAGHLFAERRGKKGKRVLLIGHLDTVFEKDSPFQRFERISDTTARGPGTEDMKGGNVVILQALKALHSVGALDDRRIVVALTGDEEMAGEPLDISRKDLIEAGKASDVALEFEAGIGGPNTATVARRGSSSWTMRVRARPGHSSGIFSEESGAGAAYEAARIIHAFYTELRGEPYLTFNVSLILGGTAVEHDAENDRGTAFGKNNVIPETVIVAGDLRALTLSQRERTKERMRAILRASLPKSSATIEFTDSYPPMAPTPGNQALFAEIDRVGRDLGLGPARAIDPGERGAADISFVAPHVDSLAGLGVVGDGAHTPSETVDLSSMPIVTKRAAVLLYRLTRE